MEGRRVALAVVADGEVDLIRGMVDLLRPLLDRVVIAEGRRTFHGQPREVFGDGWAEILDVDRSDFRSVVVDLPSPESSGRSAWQLGGIQRSSAVLGLRDLADEDLVIAVDSDEYVDPAWLVAHAARIETPIRLRMVPLFGGLDRRAPAWHCCSRHAKAQRHVDREWLVPGGVIGPAGSLKDGNLHAWRLKPASMSVEAAGWHLLHVLPPEQDPSRKYSRAQHVGPEGFTRQWLEEALALGIHPAGWWSASSMRPPQALEFLSQRHPGTVRGPLPPDEEREQARIRAMSDFGWDAIT